MRYIIIFLMLLCYPVFADFTASLERETISVHVNDIAYVNMTISSDIDDLLLITVSGKPWVSVENRIDVSAKEKKTITIRAFPYNNVVKGLYKFIIYITSYNTGETKFLELYVSVKEEKNVRVKSLKIGGLFEALGNVTIKATIQNFADISADVDGVLKICNIKTCVYEKTFSLHLDPGEENSLLFSFILPENIPYGMYEATLIYNALNKKSSIKKEFHVVKKGIPTIKKEVYLVFLGIGKKISVKNIGNDFLNVNISDKIHGFYFGPEPTYIRNSTYVWYLSKIAPGETRVIAYEINYLPLLIILIVIIFSLYFYFKKVCTVKIEKQVLQKREIKKGEEFSIIINLKNKARYRVLDVVVKDFVPLVFKVKPVEGPKPLIKKTKIGIELEWHIDMLDRNEERILSYKIVPLFGVSAPVTLPRASVRFRKLLLVFEKKSLYTKLGI